MPLIAEKKLTFTFREEWQTSKYDEWDFYQNHFKDFFGGTRGVDIVGLDQGRGLWLIEVKDYREHLRAKPEDLAMEVARKARDTLSGFAVAQRLGTGDESRFAQEALKFRQIHVVLHLEQPAKHSKLFPRAINPANVLQNLKRLVKAIDPHPRVFEMGQMGGCLWTVETTITPGPASGRSRPG